MGKNDYYDGTKLLSLKDINGNIPEIYMCTSNRNGGKTTFFNRWVINRFKKYHEKFAILYRFNYELDDCGQKFFKDIGTLFFRSDVMTSKKKAQGVYHSLYLNNIHCGYALSINNADQIKKMSHLFSDTKRILFDEFQSENHHYCDREVDKFISIHTSLARGNYQQVRYLPVIMMSNPVSLINPYYVQMGITNRLKSDTKFLKGDGYVLEQGFNESASQQQKLSGFNKAFAQNKYVAYSSECTYLDDNIAFIEKPTDVKNKYIATIRYMDKDYAIRQYADLGILYCDDRADKTFPLRISVTTDDHNINYVMLKSNDIIISQMRFYFERGCFRFKDLQSKDALLKCISY